MASFDFRPGINQEDTFSAETDSGFDFRPGVELPAAAPNDGVPPSSLTAVGSPVDPLNPPPDAFEIANQVTQQADTSNNIENAMAMQPAPSAMVAPVQLGRDGVNPVSVFNPLPVDNAQIVRDEISKIEQQPMATQERADAGLFNPNRDFGKAFEFGGLRARSDVKNLVADAESVLRETAPMKMMQTMQNAALPVVNPIRKLFGAAPLPENANEKASIAAEAAARQDATRLMDQAKAMGYRQMTTDDIDNFGDFLDWAKTSLGSSGEPMLVSLATGGWMSPLLMAGEYNTNLKEIKGLSKEKRLALASSGGLVAGFLENVGLGILVKGMPKELVGHLGGRWFADKVKKHFGARIFSAVLGGMVSEGLVEGGQEGISIGLEASVGKNFKQGEVWTRFKEAMAAGAVVGGGIRFGVQTGTETVGGVQSAITPDPLLSDSEKTVAGFIASDLLNPANAQLTEVQPEQAETEFDFRPNIEAAPVQAAEAAPTPVNMNQTTSTQVNNLQQKAAEAARNAQETEDNIKAAEGKALDLDAKRDEEFRADAEQYAKKEREKAEKLTQQAQELQQFYATPEGQRYAAEIEAIQKEADEAGLNVNIAARLNTVPRENIDAAIEVARQNLEFNKNANAAKAGNAPPIPNTPVTDPAELLAPLEGRQTRAAEGNFISEDEKQRALEVVNRLNKQLNDMGFELGQSLNVANSTEEARNLRSELIMAIGVYNELQSQRLARDKGHQNFVPAKLSRVEADFKRIFGSAEPAPAVEPAPAPAVEPAAAETAPAAEQVNPQAQPVIPFARPVADTDGQQKTVSIATPDNEVTVQAKPVILDAADLKAATGILQPRDRSLNESAIEVQRRAAKLNPAQLLDSPTTDNGAPIVARDGTIISGNGRVLSLRAVYEQFPEQAAAYKQAIAQYGTSDANYDNPVLVMMLDQDMSIEQLADFADRSNRSAIATMSATERAQRDAQAMDIGLVNMFKGGSINSIENQGFVQQFTRSVVAPTEQNTMSRNGRLTKEGFQRIQNAILATAYEDTDTLAIMLEESDEKIKNVSTALLDAAPSFAKLKSAIAAGEVDSQFDISASVTEAARIINDLRSQKPPVKPRDFFAQQNMFPNLDPNTEAIIRAFYNEELTRAKSQIIMADVLKFYTEEAAQKKQGGFFEDTTTPRDVIELARRKADGTEGQGDLLADTEQRPSRSLNESGQQTQRTAPKRSGQGLKEADTAPIKARLDDAERPSRAEVASEETVGATEDTVVAISELDSFKTQKPGTLVYRESMREGSARYMQAFQDLGLDYNKAISLPIENQFRLLSQAMVKKFGFAAVVKTDNANAKEAVDQLLVGYHNMNDMAYRLGLPAEAMGLEGTLSFVLANKRKFFGQYDPNTRSITLPKRSNSFAHEWFHALDHYLLEKYGSGLSTQVPLVSAAVRAHGTEAFAPDAPTGVKDSYYALMRALFKDKATEAMQLKAINQKMSEMEARAAKAGKSVSEMKSYQQLQNQKENILASIGKSKRVLKTDYRTNAEFFNALEGRKKEYYGTPAEMAARAFESYAIRQLVNEGLATEGMGKSQAAYDMTFEQLGVTKEELANGLAGYAKMSDSRLALTFPKGQEQVEINGAFTNLMDAIRLETELGKGEVASPTSTENIIDRRAMLNVPEREKGSFRAEQKKAKREAKLETDRVEKRIDQYGNRYKGFKKAVVVVEDAVLSPALYQKQTTLRSLIKRYPANTNLRRIYENLGTHTGGVYQSTVEGDNLANAEARQIRFFSLMLKGLFDKYDIKSMDDAELNMLRMVLTGQDTLDGAPDRVVKAAGEIRDMYNQLYDYMNSAGMEIGYARSGYIPRMLDLPNVFADETKFKSQAKKVYKIVWNEELGDTPNLSNPDIMFDTIKFIQTAKLSISELNVDGQRKSLGNSDTYQDFIKSELWQEVVDADKSLKALLRKKENDPSAVKDSEIDEARQRLQEASDFVAPEFDAFFNEMRDMFADYRSKNWLEAIQDNQSVDPAAASPQAVFSKQRELPPEADALLEDFYYQNPIDSLTSYMMAAVRKAEYNRRFGKQNMPDVANKNNYVDYLDYLIGKSGADSANGGFPDGVRLSTSEVKLLRETVNFVTGRKDSMSATMGTKAVNRATALLSMTLLIRAPISSIAEPFTVAMTSGSVVKGLHSFGMVMNELPGLRNLSKNAAEDIRLRHQFARIMGVIDDPSVSDVIMSRIGGEFNGDENLQRFLSNFFQKIQLTGITNAQRRAAARIGFQFMTEMAYEIRNPSSARNAKRAQLTLNDLGVSDGRMDQFIDYLLTLNNMNAKGKVDGKLKLPTIDQVVDENATYTDMGLQLAVSVMRFTDQSIQDPRRADRPKWAEYPAGKFVYGITSFIRSFHDKVLMGSIRKVQREARISRELGASKSRARADATAYAAAKIAAPMFTFFMAHALVSTAREYLLNQDRWDREWEESDEDALKFMRGYLFQNAFSRSGLTGAFDPLYQAWTSLKYQRDLSNILVGTAGYITQELDNAVGYFSDRNSPNTVSSEFKAYRAIWNLIAQPLISYTFAKTPMADALKLPAYGLTAGATSTTVKNYLINEIVHLLHGQRYEPGKAGRKSKSKIYTNK